MNTFFINIIIYTVGRIRIAHVPYAQSLAMEKKKVAITARNCENKEANNKTIAQTTKGNVRVAHIPQVVRFN